MTVTDKHVFFFTYKDIYSNFAWCPMHGDGKFFETNEQYFMWRKAVLFNDMETADKILMTRSPAAAKELGRQVKGFIQSVWEISSEITMKDGLLLKAKANKTFHNALVHNHREGLKHVEASPYDNIWGCGLAVSNPDIHDSSKWPGQNKLGVCMDEVAEILSQKEGYR